MFGGPISGGPRAPVAVCCPIFGGPVAALKAPKHQNHIAPPVIKRGTAPLAAPQRPAPPIPYPGDSYTPAKPVM
jgi:hypothetical protein